MSMEKVQKRSASEFDLNAVILSKCETKSACSKVWCFGENM